MGYGLETNVYVVEELPDPLLPRGVVIKWWKDSGYLNYGKCWPTQRERGWDNETAGTATKLTRTSGIGHSWQEPNA